MPRRRMAESRHALMGQLVLRRGGGIITAPPRATGAGAPGPPSSAPLITTAPNRPTNAPSTNAGYHKDAACQPLSQHTEERSRDPGSCHGVCFAGGRAGEAEGSRPSALTGRAPGAGPEPGERRGLGGRRAVGAGKQSQQPRPSPLPLTPSDQPSPFLPFSTLLPTAHRSMSGSPN